MVKELTEKSFPFNFNNNACFVIKMNSNTKMNTITMNQVVSCHLGNLAFNHEPISSQGLDHDRNFKSSKNLLWFLLKPSTMNELVQRILLFSANHFTKMYLPCVSISLNLNALTEHLLELREKEFIILNEDIIELTSKGRAFLESQLETD